MQRISKIFLIVPFLIYLYPAIACLLSTSRTPLILGRYSEWLALLNLWHIILFGFAIYSFKKGIRGLEYCAYLLLILTALFSVAKSEIRELPMAQIMLPLVRMSAGFAIIFLTFQGRNLLRPRQSGAWLAVGTLIIFFSVIDIGLFIAAETMKPKRKAVLKLRDEYDFKKIATQDIIIVGDSFVWGTGLKEGERFGNQLETLLNEKKKGPGVRVYSLGIGGAALPQYIDLISKVPRPVKVRQVILAYYLNDFPAPSDFSMYIENALSSLRIGSMTLGVVADQIVKRRYSFNVDKYHAFIIKCYEKSEPTFEKRREILKVQFKRFKDLSDQRSENPPILLIIPLMVDFRHYPLDEAHRDLAKMASEEGYTVIDLLPIFRDRLGDGVKYRLSVNDNHFNAYTHGVVADVIKGQIELDPK